MPKTKVKRPATLNTPTKVNFIRAYLNDLSAIRANLMTSVVPDGNGKPSFVPNTALKEIDDEVVAALRELAKLRRELVPTTVEDRSTGFLH